MILGHCIEKAWANERENEAEKEIFLSSGHGWNVVVEVTGENEDPHRRSFNQTGSNYNN